METLLDILTEEYGDDLLFENGKVAWDKSLLLALRDLGYNLELKDHATRVFLYKNDELIKELDYEVQEMEPDIHFSSPYDVLLLDLSGIEHEEDEDTEG